MDRRLHGKIALITGAASGIGCGIARCFAKHGAELAITDINEEGLDKAGDACNAAIRQKLDVTSHQEWEEVVEFIRSRFGRLDVLVNSAGIAIADDTIEQLSRERFNSVMDINLGGTFNACAASLPLLKINGGSIINLGSIRSHRASRNTLAYTTSKHALLGFTRALALDCAGQSVRVNLICPGAIETAMQQQWISQASDPTSLDASMKADYPLGRFGTVDEVANLALYLASDESAFTTGAQFTIDGGFLA